MEILKLDSEYIARENAYYWWFLVDGEQWAIIRNFDGSGLSLAQVGGENYHQDNIPDCYKNIWAALLNKC